MSRSNYPEIVTDDERSQDNSTSTRQNLVTPLRRSERLRNRRRVEAESTGVNDDIPDVAILVEEPYLPDPDARVTNPIARATNRQPTRRHRLQRADEYAMYDEGIHTPMRRSGYEDREQKNAPTYSRSESQSAR
jgi:hypothetical protein